MKKNIFAFIIVASLGFMSCEDFIEHEKEVFKIWITILRQIQNVVTLSLTCISVHC